MQPRHIQAHTYGTRAPHIRTIKQIRVRSFQCARAIVLHFSFFFGCNFFSRSSRWSELAKVHAGEMETFDEVLGKKTSIERIGWHLFALCQFLSSAHKAFIYVWHRASHSNLRKHLSFGKEKLKGINEKKKPKKWRR